MECDLEYELNHRIVLQIVFKRKENGLEAASRMAGQARGQPSELGPRGNPGARSQGHTVKYKKARGPHGKICEGQGLAKRARPKGDPWGPGPHNKICEGLVGPRGDP